MEQFFIYMVKASGLIAVFFAAYYVFLKKETFFVSNRWFLLAGIVTSLLLPVIVFTKIVWIDPQPIQEVNVIDVSQLLLMQQGSNIADATIALSWPNIVLGIYIAGVLFLTVRLIITFISLRRILKDVKAVKKDGFSFIDTQKIQAPFSFFNYIVYNSAILLPHELESILEHEKVHSGQKHSADMLISQLLTIFFWFNPFAWLYKKSISQNLEFIADSYAARQISDTTAYQKTLLKITLQPEYISITNHFYQSLIKKRIVMLNKKQSGKLNSWKYALVLPALTAFIYLFQIKVVAQERDNSKAVEEISQEKFKMAFEVNKNSGEKDFEKIKELCQREFNASVTFSDVTRNSESEITAIKVTVNNGSEPKVFQTKGNKAINPFVIELEKSDNNNTTVAFTALPLNNEYKMYADNVEYFDEEDLIAPPAPPAPIALVAPRSSVAPPAPPAPTVGFIQPGMQNGLQVINSANNDVLVIINGKKQEKGATVTIPNGQTIASLNMLSGKDAKKKYGKQAKEGALEIITQKEKGGNYVVKMPKGIMLDPDMLQNFYINPISMMDVEALAQLDGEMAKRIEEQMKLIEEMSEADKTKMKILIERDLQNIERSEAQLQRNQQRMEEQKMRLQRRSQERQERNSDRAKERDEARKQMEEMRKEMEEARKEIMESRKEIEKELERIRNEKE